MTGIALTNATILDGTGASSYIGDVLVEAGRITDITSSGQVRASTILDCTGLLLTPGFIDIHSHSDLTLLLDPRAASAIYQGVTLEVIGNCGHGCAPLQAPGLARDAMYGPIPDESFFTWSTMAGYLDQLESARPAVNVVALVPNGQLRLSHVGPEQRAATPAELEAMARELAGALDDGAFGFSTGLEYPRERDAATEEIDHLCRVVASRRGLYATHTRNRDRSAIAAIDEAIGTARRTGVRLQISHITPRGPASDTELALARAGSAASEGIDIGFDMHTRLFGYTHLKNLVPLGVLAGSRSDILRRLAEPSTVELVNSHPNLISGVGDWSRVVLSDSAMSAELNGQSFAEIARQCGCSPIAAAIKILMSDVDNLERPMVLLKTYSEDVLRTTYQSSSCMIGSDAATLAPDGILAGATFHGAYTWASWFIRRMVRELGAVTLTDAIYRLTGLPAQRLCLADRGRIAVGCRADIAVMDFKTYADAGTVDTPSRLATGMRHVLVNGVVTMLNGAQTNRRAGVVLRASRLG